MGKKLTVSLSVIFKHLQVKLNISIWAVTVGARALSFCGYGSSNAD
jgi:hypothetical protein